MATIKWTAGPVELVQNRDGELELIKATPKSDPTYTFDENSLASLFATMKESKQNVRAAHLVLHGADTYPDSDFPIAMDAATMRESKKGVAYSYVYSAAQVKAFKPQGYALRLKFHKPCLYVFQTDFQFAGKTTGGNKRAPLTVNRINVDGETAPKVEAQAPKPRGPRQQG